MKTYLSVLLISISSIIFAQIKFEPGYIILKDGSRKDVLIKNMDWRSNPTKIEIKTNENLKSEIIPIEELQLFEIFYSSKYIKSTVLIDESSSDLSKLTYESEPKFIKKDLLLKVLVMGEANLYSFSEGDEQKFFYATADKNIEQLIYKPYWFESNKIAYNKSYRSQLIKSFKCDAVSKENLMKINYREKDLINLFQKINNCQNTEVEYLNTHSSNKKIDFNLNIRPRINFNSLDFQTNNIEFRNLTFDKKLTFGIGLEAEFILPFYKNKWAILIEPNYVSYKAENVSVAEISGITTTHSLNYQALDVPIGVRHYMFLNEKSKLFINAQFIPIFSLDSKIEAKRNSTNVGVIEFGNGTNLGIGAGYKYLDRYSLEMRYVTDLKSKGDYDSKFNMLSIILGYKIF
ncbi:porin family protein [Faecalibacter bovis]|uniref:Outer membrane beta-barrel protein n=1 Tax=Faecalibacter bovis TaxID=2898187 RepID=A0ABX7XAN7_9FLAO|nr:outer membrane beta-barrel protein [Faecalibacter bovis]QTV04958.1 outer membrane beta-barrel protein [Faecalibacter bovis]